MPFLVTLAFDLHGAEPKVYREIQNSFARIDLAKVLYVRANKTVRLRQRFIAPKRQVQLPSNTFAAKLSRANMKKASEVTKFIKGETERIFRQHRVRGRYFIVAGKDWSWRAGSAGCKGPTMRSC